MHARRLWATLALALISGTAMAQSQPPAAGKAPAATKSPAASPARDACLLAKYKAHRDIARRFQTRRVEILKAAVPEASAGLDAQLAQQLAANDRLDIAFKHLLSTDRAKIVIVPETQAWLILSPSDDADLVAKVPDYKAAKEREAAAIAAQKAAGSVPALGKFSRETLADRNSPLSTALREGAAAFAANDKKPCP
jgi:hypothetical protein